MSCRHPEEDKENFSSYLKRPFIVLVLLLRGTIKIFWIIVGNRNSDRCSRNDRTILVRLRTSHHGNELRALVKWIVILFRESDDRNAIVSETRFIDRIGALFDFCYSEASLAHRENCPGVKRRG